jgi:hypothetical protein
MDNTEQEQWLKTKQARLYIAKEYFHHHARQILMANYNLKDIFTQNFNRNIAITPRIKDTKKNYSKAIEAKSLNEELRLILRQNATQNLKFEVIEDRGVFYFSSSKNSIGGFDFAYINHKKNLISLWNLCFGEVRYHDGLKRWNKFIEKNPELLQFAPNDQSDDHGKDFQYQTTQNDPPLFVGEIQFGNWALAYRDFFKVLKANVQNNIDCLIYIVPTGNLENLLSDGIVTYDNTVKILEEFAKVISVPVWVIGLDIN